MTDNVTDFPAKPPAPTGRYDEISVHGTTKAGDVVKVWRYKDFKTDSSHIEIILWSREGLAEPWQKIAAFPDTPLAIEYCKIVAGFISDAFEIADLNSEEAGGVQ